MYNIREGTIHMFTYWKQPIAKNQNTIHTYLSHVVMSTSKVYTSPDFRSISYIHAEYTLLGVHLCDFYVYGEVIYDFWYVFIINFGHSIIGLWKIADWKLNNIDLTSQRPLNGNVNQWQIL